MDRRLSAAPLRVVDDVVVHERRRVNELDDGRIEDGQLAGVTRQPRGHQQYRRPDALAAAVLDVTPDFRDQIDLRLDVAVELRLDLLEVGPDRFEHLNERRERGGVLLDGVEVFQSGMITPYSVAECQR